MSRDATILGLMRDSVTAPGATAAQLLDLCLPRRILFEAVALLAVVGGLVAGLAGGVVLPIEDGSEIVIGPIPWALILGAGMLLSASSLQVAGRLLGGRGKFEDALLVTVWINALGFAVELLSILLSLVSLSLASVAMLAGFVVLLWSLINFVRVLHGFDGILRSILAILLAGFGTLVGLSFILGIAISLGGAANV